MLYAQGLSIGHNVSRLALTLVIFSKIDITQKLSDQLWFNISERINGTGQILWANVDPYRTPKSTIVKILMPSIYDYHIPNNIYDKQAIILVEEKRRKFT